MFRFRRSMVSFLFVVSSLITLSISVSAVCQQSIASLYTDSDTEWNRLGTKHMGSKSTTYSFDESISEIVYLYPDLNYIYDDIRAGIALWGNDITCTESANGMGAFAVSMTSNGNTIAEVSESVYGSDGHITSWTVTMYSVKFNSAHEDGLGPTVIAHELGHVFGLAHVDVASKLMYYAANSAQSITNSDRLGMRTMTHAHTHGTSTSYTIEQYSVAQHKKRCVTCCAFYLISCTYASHYHSGNYHYFQMACSCGNSGLKQISCKPLTCPYTGGQIMQS